MHEHNGTRNTDQPAITINCEPPSRSGALVLNGGFRARCSCGWSSDCYSQLSDTERATQVHNGNFSGVVLLGSRAVTMRKIGGCP
jgi:hypothetical protein